MKKNFSDTNRAFCVAILFICTFSVMACSGEENSADGDIDSDSDFAEKDIEQDADKDSDQDVERDISSDGDMDLDIDFETAETSDGDIEFDTEVDIEQDNDIEIETENEYEEESEELPPAVDLGPDVVDVPANASVIIWEVLDGAEISDGLTCVWEAVSPDGFVVTEPETFMESTITLSWLEEVTLRLVCSSDLSYELSDEVTLTAEAHPCVVDGCSNDLACDGLEFCEPSSGCNDGENIDCGHGTCTEPSGDCDCTGTGYQGESCSEDINECEAGTHTCSGDTPYCVNNDGGFDCVECLTANDCTDDLFCTLEDGATCSEGVCNYVDRDCGNGTCGEDQNACLCDGNWNGAACDVCKTGYEGESCETCAEGYYEYPASSGLCIVDPCYSETCNGHGSCDNSSGSAVCNCTGGWSGSTCQTPPLVPTVSNVVMDCDRDGGSTCSKTIDHQLTFDSANADTYEITVISDKGWPDAGSCVSAPSPTTCSTSWGGDQVYVHVRVCYSVTGQCAEADSPIYNSY